MGWKNWPSWVKYWLKALITYAALIILFGIPLFEIIPIVGIGPVVFTIIIGVGITLIIGLLMGSIADKLKSKSKKK